jgi:hypothetical protein
MAWTMTRRQFLAHAAGLAALSAICPGCRLMFDRFAKNCGDSK